MAMDLNNLTYGRNFNNSAKLVDDLYKDIERIKSSLKGSAYSDLTGVINKYWNGTDKDDFLKDLDQRVTNISKDLDKIYDFFWHAINDDYETFITKQGTFYKSVKK